MRWIGLEMERKSVDIFIVFFMVNLLINCLEAAPTSNEKLMEKLIELTIKVDTLSSKSCQQDTKLDSIDQKLSILLNKGGGANSETFTLTGFVEGNEQSTSGNSEGSGATTGSASTEAGIDQIPQAYHYDICVNLISVERNPTEDGNRYTVRFTKNAQEIFYRYHDDHGPEKAPDSVVEEAGGVWAVSFTCGNTSVYQTTPWFTVGDIVHEQVEDLSFFNSRQMVHIQLKNDELSAATQDIPAIPALYTLPAWEAVYQPGQDFNVTAFVPKSQQHNDPVDYMYSSFNGIDLQTGELQTDFEKEKLFQELYLEPDPNKVEETATVLTSTQSVSGYLSFGAAIKNTEGAVVQLLQLNRAIRVRPSNQPGAMPAGYLGIYNFGHIERSGNGNLLFRCGVGYECWQHCFAIGETLSKLEVTRLLPDGSHVDVPSAYNPTHAAHMDTILSVYWQFQAEEDSGDSEGITTFQCKATDSTGRVVTKLVDVLSMIDGSIDHELSGVEIEHDPMNAAIVNITFNCAVRGRPPPEVVFSNNYTRAFNFNYDPPDEIITTDSGVAIAKKVVTLDLYDLSLDINENEEENPYCEIYVPTQNVHVRYNFEVPHIDW